MLRLCFAFLIACSLVGCTIGLLPTEQARVADTATPLPTRTPRPTSTPTETAPPPQARPTSTPIPSETPIDLQSLPGFGYGPDEFPEDINPLTGLQVSDMRLLNRRPMAIKITNFPREVRPQWGLNAADHVYEYYLEQELTRFIGVFYGQDASRVGPVRSARPFDEQIVRMYKAILAFGYADFRMMDYLLNSDIRHLLVIQRPDNCPPLCRIGSGDEYNNLFADTAQLSQYFTDRGLDNSRQELSGLRFEANTLITYGGGKGQRVTIHYSDESYHRWEYDPLTQRYLRWQDTARKSTGEEAYQPLIDSLTGLQVYADNLVILLVPTNYFHKSSSTEVFEYNLMREGEAYALRQGRMFRVLWKRALPEALITLRFPGNAPYPLKPGNTWFIVLGQTSYHEILADGDWRFVHGFP